VSCNLAILRNGPGGEKILLPAVLRNSNRMSLDEIESTIRRCRQTPLAELPEVQAIERAKKMPLLAFKYFSFKVRSDARYYQRHFGTYGMSSLLRSGGRSTPQTSVTHVYANTAIAFAPMRIADEPCVVDGQIVPRKILTMTVVGDHHVVDGHDVVFALEELS